MTEDLEQFYKTLQEIDQWLDQAIERSRDLQSSKDNIHNQFNDFKVPIFGRLILRFKKIISSFLNLNLTFNKRLLLQEFIEEIQGKETEISGVIKMADDFRDTAQVRT